MYCNRDEYILNKLVIIIDTDVPINFVFTKHLLSVKSQLHLCTQNRFVNATNTIELWSPAPAVAQRPSTNLVEWR